MTPSARASKIFTLEAKGRETKLRTSFLGCVTKFIAAGAISAWGMCLLGSSPARGKEDVPERPIAPANEIENTDRKEGTLYLSDGKTHRGRVYTTPGKRLRIYRREKGEYLEFPIRAIARIEVEVEEERMEPEWRWKEAASDEKVYTGKAYPMRKLLTSITLADGETYKGDVSAPIYVLEEGAKKASRYLLHRRQKGEIDQTLKDLVYISRIDLGKVEKVKGEGGASENP